jgi:hypothetical protein
MSVDTLPTRKPPYRDVFTKDRTRRTPVILSDGTSVEYPAGWDKKSAKKWREYFGLLKPSEG